MPSVAALYRHPVKGFTPEPLDAADLTAGGWFSGDRMWAVEAGPSGFDPGTPKQISKTAFAVLMRSAAVAKVLTRLDEASNTLSVSHPDGSALSVRLDDPEDRAAFADWLAPRLGDEVEGPLKLIPAGPDHRFMDSRNGFVSVLNLASVRDLESRMGVPVDSRRFRANILVEGWPAWVENGWAEHDIGIGDTTLRGIKPIVRCAATHVDPDTGERDLDVCGALFQHYGHVLCGLYASIEAGGRIAVGDTVRMPS